MSTHRQVLELLLRDIKSTLGARYDHVVERYAAAADLFEDNVTAYRDRVVHDVQQYFHDTFVDTVWPVCPNHPNHPMWFENGAWHADGKPVAKLGDLESAYRR